jgi:hypothetical protein
VFADEAAGNERVHGLSRDGRASGSHNFTVAAAPAGGEHPAVAREREGGQFDAGVCPPQPPARSPNTLARASAGGQGPLDGTVTR